MSSPVFRRLLEPCDLGGLRLRNRIVMSPMEVDFGSRDGEVTARTIDHYRERAAGGVGLVIVEATCVEAQRGRLSPRQLVIDSDAGLVGWKRLTRAVRAKGASILLQLNHAGRKATSLVTGKPPLGPSPLANHWGETPEELSQNEIDELVERYAEAAARARLAGFDGVELHAAHGYLISQFLSPTYNQRRDEYGGSVANRARFLLQIVAAVRQRVGESFPILCRLSAVEYSAAGAIEMLADGITLRETRQVARLLEQAGVQALDISATLIGAATLHPMSWPEGMLLPLAAEIRQAVSIPVIATGRISPRAGEEALRKGHADLIALARSLLADPYLPTKLADGRAKDIVPCLYCPACLDPGISAEGARCAVNPALGHDRELRLRPAGRSKRVVVIGGGPGGMEAARVAARRGHEVVLFERRAALGGRLLPWSGHESAQASIEQFRRYLTRQVCQSGVELRLGVRGSVDLVAAERPDTVVVATGGTSPDFQEPGLDGEQAIDAIEVLRGRPTGDTVAVIGAEFLGCDVALFLARQGKSVALLTERPRPAMEVTQAMAGFFLRELETHGVEQWNRVRFEERVASGVRISDRRGDAVTVPADSVVRATEARDRREEDALVNVLESHVPQVLTVGGGSGFLGLTEAIDGGYRAGCAVA